MTVCAVASCKSDSRKDKTLSFHSFPKSEKLMKVWVDFCERKENWNPSTSFLCSKHFEKKYFELNFRQQLLNTKSKTKLVKDAYPTIKNEQQPPPDRENTMSVMEKALLVEQLLGDISSQSSQENIPPSFSAGISNSPCRDEDNLPSEGEFEWKMKYEQLLEKNSQQQTEIEMLRLKCEKNEQTISMLTEKISAQAEKIEFQLSELKNRDDLISKVLTKAQKNKLENDKRWVRWSSEDISRAFTLRYLSQRTYLHLRNNLSYPLPHLGTLRKWASTLNFRNGILHDVLNFMKIAGLSKTDKQKVCVLAFDEVKMKSTYEYDKILDQIIGPYNQMQVVMVRGLFQLWKQPIYLNFDQPMTKEILTNLITELHKIGYDVVACVSDCGSGNQGLWNQKSLDITHEKPYFFHPISNEKIFIFPDAPHLLKLIRNWLLDTGFVLEGGEVVSKKPLEDLLKIVDDEINVVHKLTEKHVNCRKTERQNVGLASQLMSHPVAKALLKYQPGNKSVAKSTGNFISTVATWMDIMNSYSPSQGQHSRKPYGFGDLLEHQDSSLNEMFNLFKSMVCTGKQNLQVFQKAVLISIRSLQSLLKDMRRRYNCIYIITHRLNQDCLESLFSQVRARGGLHDHPTPLEAIYRLRIIVLGKNPGVLQEKTNIGKSVEIEEYVTCSVFSKAKVILEATEIEDNTHSLHQELDELVQGQLNSSSSDNFSTTSSSTSGKDAEKDAFQYLCGYVARKFHSKYPDMGKYTKDTPIEHGYSQPPDWLQFLSFGGLTTPSQKWLCQAKKIEKRFIKLHDKKFDGSPNITKKLIDKIKEKEKELAAECPQEVMKSYIIQRYYIRIKYLNRQKDISKIMLKRKADPGTESYIEHSKLYKKMRKTIE